MDKGKEKVSQAPTLDSVRKDYLYLIANMQTGKYIRTFNISQFYFCHNLTTGKLELNSYFPIGMLC